MWVGQAHLPPPWLYMHAKHRGKPHGKPYWDEGLRCLWGREVIYLAYVRIVGASTTDMQRSMIQELLKYIEHLPP